MRNKITGCLSQVKRVFVSVAGFSMVEEYIGANLHLRIPSL